MLRARVVLAVLLVTAALAGCADRATTGRRQGSAAPPTTATAPAPATTSPPAGRAEWPTGPRRAHFPAVGPAATLVALRTGRHAGYERVVFEFDGRLIGYDVRYVPEVTLGESDQAAPLPGTAFLQASFQPAVAHQLRGGAVVNTLKGPETLRPRYPVVQQVTLASDWEGEVRFGLGLSGKAGFRLLRLDNPTRMVLDLAT